MFVGFVIQFRFVDHPPVLCISAMLWGALLLVILLCFEANYDAHNFVLTFKQVFPRMYSLLAFGVSRISGCILSAQHVAFICPQPNTPGTHNCVPSHEFLSSSSNPSAGHVLYRVRCKVPRRVRMTNGRRILKDFLVSRSLVVFMVKPANKANKANKANRDINTRKPMGWCQVFVCLSA